MERDPDSAGYWRRNTIAGLRLMQRPESLASDPEDLAALRANRAELARLEARESAVRARHARLYASKPPVP